MQISLPDGSKRQFDSQVSIFNIAEDIGPGLAKAAIAGKVNGELVDLSHELSSDADVAILTGKCEDSIEIIRHSTAHLLAHAVKSLFPTAQVTIGPVIEDGFYYDFAFERSFTPEDFKRIETKMKELAKQNIPVKRRELSRDEAIKLFSDMGEVYKVQIIKDIPGDETLSVYEQGDFVDLCRGPHVPTTKLLKHFKLTKLAGAYWRGDSNNEMLQRIYGTAWGTKDDLQTYIKRIEEAEKRDHRLIAKKLDLFHIQDCAQGMVFWHPKGWAVYQVLEQYIRRKLDEHDYQEIKTPQLVSSDLFKTSGHFQKFGDEMFKCGEEEPYQCLKPMSCPGHVELFKQGLRSYRDLPLRFAEFGCCHRNEASGTLHGLMRVRGMTQDDGHLFCTQDQVAAESEKFIHLLHEVYNDFGFTDVTYKLATRPENRYGSDEVWDAAEKALGDAMDNAGIEWSESPGEGAFYGPKIEFTLRDCLGREWQLGTLQVDYVLPDRLGAVYVNEDGEKRPPVMLHRAILGSLERFIGILIEHYAGVFPMWLAPIQVVAMNIADRHSDFTKKIVTFLRKNGIRANFDLRNEKIGFKIREHTLQRIPVLLIIGDKEIETNTVSVRLLSGENLESKSIEDVYHDLENMINERTTVMED